MRLSKYLMDDESIELETRRHIGVLFAPGLVALAGVIGALAIGWFVSPNDGGDPVDLMVGGVGAFLVMRFLWRILEWRATTTVITNKRLFKISGVVSRKVSSLPLARLTDLTYRRPVLGRLLGYGEIVAESAGSQHGSVRLDHLPKPDRSYRTIAALVAVRAASLGPEPVEVTNWDEEDTGPLPRVIV